MRHITKSSISFVCQIILIFGFLSSAQGALYKIKTESNEVNNFEATKLEREQEILTGDEAIRAGLRENPSVIKCGRVTEIGEPRKIVLVGASLDDMTPVRITESVGGDEVSIFLRYVDEIAFVVEAEKTNQAFCFNHWPITSPGWQVALHDFQWVDVNADDE